MNWQFAKRERSIAFAKQALGAVLVRGLGFAVLWWVISEGNTADWGVGAVGVILATISSVWLWPLGMRRIIWAGLFCFVGFFLVQSIKAGVQVAVRALRPHPDLAPALVDILIKLPPGPATVLLVDTLSLLPGTLSVRLDGELLRLHVLDARRPVLDEVRAAEKRIACLFGIQT